MTITEEQWAWDDLVRLHAVETRKPVPAEHRPAQGRRRDPAGLEEIAVGGLFAGLMLVFVGAVGAGLTVAAVAALGWLLLRRRSRPAGAAEETTLPVTGDPWRGRHPRHLGP